MGGRRHSQQTAPRGDTEPGRGRKHLPTEGIATFRRPTRSWHARIPTLFVLAWSIVVLHNPGRPRDGGVFLPWPGGSEAAPRRQEPVLRRTGALFFGERRGRTSGGHLDNLPPPAPGGFQRDETPPSAAGGHGQACCSRTQPPGISGDAALSALGYVHSAMHRSRRGRRAAKSRAYPARYRTRRARPRHEPVR